MDKAIEEQMEVIAWSVGKRKIALNTSEVSRCVGISCSTLEQYRKQNLGIEYKKEEVAGKKSRVVYPTLNVAKWLCNTIKTA